MAKTLIGTATTDENGVATITYTATGAGDVTIQASVFNSNNFYTDTEDIEDCMYWNSGSSVSSLIYDTGTTCTSNGEYISFGTSTSGEKYCKIPITIENDSNWELEYTVAKIGTAQTSAFQIIYGTNDYVLCRPRDGKISVDGTKIGNNGYSRDFQTNDVINWKYMNGTLTVTLNGTVTLYHGVTAISDITALRWYTNQNRMQYFKNIKLKPIQPISISVTATNDVLSYIDGDTTTLIATLSPVQSGKIIEIYQDNILVATEQTDSNGQVSIPYQSQGIGDTVFKFKYENIEETKIIEDCRMYIGTNTSKINISNKQGIHGKTSTTITNMTVQDDWIVITSSGGNNWGLLWFDGATGINEPCKIRVTRGDNNNWGIATWNSNSTARGNALTGETSPRTIEFWNQSGTTPWGTKNSITKQSGMNYILEMVVNGHTFTTNVYDLDENLIGTYTYTGDSSVDNTTNIMKYGFITNNATNGIKLKDFKIKPITI